MKFGRTDSHKRKVSNVLEQHLHSSIEREGVVVALARSTDYWRMAISLRCKLAFNSPPDHQDCRTARPKDTSVVFHPSENAYTNGRCVLLCSELPMSR